MKKFTFLVLSIFILGSFWACDEGPLQVSIEDNNANSQFNVNVAGKSFVSTYTGISVDKTVTMTDAFGNVTQEVTNIPLSEVTINLDFSSLSDGEGTFTYSVSAVFLPAMDTPYIGSGDADNGVSYSTYYNRTGYSGVEYYSLEASGIYKRVKESDGTFTYTLELDTPIIKIMYYDNSTSDTYLANSSASSVLNSSLVVSKTTETEYNDEYEMSNSYFSDLDDGMYQINFYIYGSGIGYTSGDDSYFTLVD